MSKKITNKVTQTQVLFLFLPPFPEEVLGLNNLARKRHWFIARKIKYFLFKLADAKRLHKKVNLNQRNAKLGLWDSLDDEQAPCSPCSQTLITTPTTLVTTTPTTTTTTTTTSYYYYY